MTKKTKKSILIVKNTRKPSIWAGNINPLKSVLKKAEIDRHLILEEQNKLLLSIANIATNAWRAKLKMIDINTGEVRDDMKRVYRHVEAIIESLKQMGIEIIDFTGKPYDTGMALKVITFEKVNGLTREEISETIKPTILWHSKHIQYGEVIVGTP